MNFFITHLQRPRPGSVVEQHIDEPRNECGNAGPFADLNCLGVRLGPVSETHGHPFHSRGPT